MELLKIILFVILILILIVVGAIIIDSNHFVVRHFYISSDKISKPHNFLFISDLHNKYYGKKNRRLFKKIDEEEVEACLLAGDIMTASPGEPVTRALEFIEHVSQRYPVYYSYGNHEYRARIYPDLYKGMFDEYSKGLEKLNVRLLDNETVLFDEEIDITALTIDKKYYKRFSTPKMDDNYLTDTLGNLEDGRYHILLAHNPDYFKDYTRYGADLTLSGHVHGGIVRIPFWKGLLSPRVTFFPKYEGGMFKNGEKSMIVNRGLGCHSIPIRVFNPGEIIVIHINKA